LNEVLVYLAVGMFWLGVALGLMPKEQNAPTLGDNVVVLLFWPALLVAVAIQAERRRAEGKEKQDATD
jgi:hypothetical protein